MPIDKMRYIIIIIIKIKLDKTRKCKKF